MVEPGARDVRTGPSCETWRSGLLSDTIVPIDRYREGDALSGKAGGPRIALYSHDTCGLGHLRRNLLAASVFARGSLSARVLMISGAAEARLFPTPDGVDCITLPALAKGADGAYRSRSLGLGLDELLDLRAATMRAALKSFRPDLLVVDKVPRGALGELDVLLTDLRRAGRTRVVLGMRDILDDPASVRDEWQREGHESAISRYYDEIWVYGDRRVYDVAEEYGFSDEVSAKLRYTGYFDRRISTGPGPDDSEGDSRDSILCMVGGGQDGFGLAESFAATTLPAGTHGVIISGPFMPDDRRARLADLCNSRPDMELREFVTDPRPLIRGARRIICMGGYNSICEVLAHGTPTLVVPRVSPRREQLVRAQCFRDLGLVDLCHPDLASPDVLRDWLERPTTCNASSAIERVDFNGLDRLPSLAARVLQMGARRRTGSARRVSTATVKRGHSELGV